MSKINPINLSPSFLSTLLKSGYDLAVAQKIGGGELELPNTPAMNAGKAVHSFISEAYGGKQDEIAISPYDTFRTKEAREWRDSQPDNIIILKQEEADVYLKIAQRVKNHAGVKKILDGAKLSPEKTITKKVNGYTVKGIIDIVAIKGDVVDVIDWKFVSSQVFDDFSKKALWNNYDLQASVYDFLETATHVYFVVIENEAPYRIKVWNCDLSFLESGADKFNKALKIIKEENWRQVNFDIEEQGELLSWEHIR